MDSDSLDTSASTSTSMSSSIRLAGGLVDGPFPISDWEGWAEIGADADADADMVADMVCCGSGALAPAPAPPMGSTWDGGCEG